MTQIKDSWKAKGYVDEPVPQGVDLKAEIRRMCKEKNAIILAHYYTEGVLQDIADFVGDSSDWPNRRPKLMPISS